MPITAEQAKRELARRELERRGVIEPQISPQKAQRIMSLQKQLGGRLPTTGELPAIRRIGPDVLIGLAERTQEKRRREAYQELLKSYSPGRIASALAFEQAIQPRSRLPQMIGATAGSLAALGLGQIPPFTGAPEELATVPAAAKIGAQAMMAGFGGVAGRALQMYADPDEEFNRRELQKTFGEEFGLELATMGLGAIGKRAIGGARRTLIPGARRLSRRLTEAGRRAGLRKPTRLLPAQFSENQLLDTIQGIGENSLIGSNAVFQFRKGQLRAAEQLASELADTMAKGASKRSVDDVAALVFDTIEGKEKAFKEAAYHLFGTVDDAVGGARISMLPAKAVANEITERAGRAGRIGQTGTSLTLLDRITNEVDDVIDFRTAQDIRSGLLDVLRRAESKISPDPKAVGIVKRLIPQVDRAMEEGARRMSPEATQLWRNANRFYKKGAKTFNSKLIRRLTANLPDHPEIVTKTIFRPNASASIRLTKKVAGPQTFQKLKASWLQQLLTDTQKIDPSTATGVGEVMGKRFLKKFNNLGQSTLDIAFTKSEQAAVRDTARILAIVEAKTGGHSGALRFVQGSALAGVVAAPFVPGEVGKGLGVTSGVILLGPAVLGKLMTKKWFARLLSEGYRVPKGSQQAVALGARIAKAALNMRKEINEERQKRIREEEIERARPLIPSVQQLRGFGGRGF